MTTVSAGAAVVDVTPPAGLPMSGFAGRTAPASGCHDPLTVRALCVDDTAVVTVDVVGLDEDACAEVRARCALPDDGVVVHAVHTHGGPQSMTGRLGDRPAAATVDRLVDACVEAVTTAARCRRRATLHAGWGADPDVARNRRREAGPVDTAVPVVRVVGEDGVPVSVLTSYACHPVVLGADNTLWTADYPGVVRAELERRSPGAVALFLTGCAGDANTGHPASASVTTVASDRRTFAECELVGRRVAAAADAAPLAATPGPVSAARRWVDLVVDVPDAQTLRRDAATWAEMADRESDAASRALLHCWQRWAHAQLDGHELDTRWRGAVSVLRWAGVTLVALPGEPFAETALRVRRSLGVSPPGQGPAGAIPDARPDPGDVVVVAGYSNGCPGYLPPKSEYPSGGYEVLEAHRYYGMPGPFAPGSAERLEAAVTSLAAEMVAAAEAHR